jgi:non-ribosomal peptide synthetase-like protein
VFEAAAAAPARTLVDIFRTTVATYPDAIGLEGPTETLTYRQLADRVDERAALLRRAGVCRGDRVGVRIPSGTTDLYVAILAVLHTGASYVPVDWDDSDERAHTVFSEAAVVLIIAQNFEFTPGPGSRTDGRDHHVWDAADPPAVSDDAWIIFTSGSTGKPKGVAVSHRSAAALVDAESSLYLVDNPLGPDDRVMAGLSVAFDASCEEMWLAWRYGAALVVAHRDIVKSGPDLGQWIVDQRITVVSTVPTLASLWPVEALDTVRLLIFGGEACSLDLAVRLNRPGREVWNTYGPTETTVIACGAVLAPEPPVRIGKPIKGYQLAVVDPQTGAPVAWGETGELVVSGVGLARYLDAEKDAQKYAPLPALGWERAYRTGDMVIADPEGLLFAGRTDDQIKLGGKRLELGEIDNHLANMPGVNSAAAALHKSNAGTDVLVGYLTQYPGEQIDLSQVRSLMADRLPNGIAPVLTVVDELPMKTSGKVDRNALPWPLPATGAGSPSTTLTSTQAWLKGLWQDQLGPLPVEPDTDFFEIGGGSVQVARLVAEIRRSYPAAEIGKVYTHSTLGAMAEYVGSLDDTVSRRPSTGPLPAGPRAFQTAFICGAYFLNGIRYVVATVIVVWILGALFGAGWVPHVPFWPVAIGWLVFFSTPGRIGQAVIVGRVLTRHIRPGIYQRGGWTHTRLWAADRFLNFLRLEPVCGTGFSAGFHRLMGNRVGHRSQPASMPPVSGLVTIGDDVAIEHEVDLSGYWIEGDRVYVGAIHIDNGARIGTRSLVGPGVSVGARAEVLPGAHVNRDIPSGELWAGSPIACQGVAGLSWPDAAPHREQDVSFWSRTRLRIAEAAGLFTIAMLPVLALIPAVALVLPQVIDFHRFTSVAAVLAVWVPAAAVLTAFTWLGLVIVAVRILAGWIAPGYFAQNSRTGWAVWMTHALLQRTLTAAYPIYASLATPVFLRLLGANVGKNTEISTIETLPHLTWLQDETFIADHALVTSTRQYGGWIHVGTTVIGRGSFVGNSAIVGPDTDLPPDALVAVLASTPRRAPAGSSWLGRTADQIPRTKSDTDDARTYRPTVRVKLARGIVEAFRIVPFMITIWTELGLIAALNGVYMSVFLSTKSQLAGLGVAFLAALPIVLFSGIVATAIAIGVKWLLLGRFKQGQRPLFDSFVWRNELADVFAESLAVPSLIRLSIGSPVFNLYARLMGTRVGRHVWCETWWLPEFDLIELGDYVTVNRGTVVQTHLFHDRVMSLARTEIGSGSTLGANSFMLPGAAIGSRTVVGNASLVLRDESLPSDTYWDGNPAQFVQTSEVGHQQSPASPAQLCETTAAAAGSTNR